MTEFADGGRGVTRSSPFPREWGSPPYDALERAAWIAAHLDGANVRMLPPGQDPPAEPPMRAHRRPASVGHRQAVLDLLARRWTGA